MNHLTQEFNFDLVGFDAPPCFIGKFEAKDEEGALREARKFTKQFSLPGWSIVCRETKNKHPAVAFFDRQDTLLRPEKVYR